MAKLRVGCTVAGWAPGTPRMDTSCRFQSITDCPDPAVSASATGGPPLPDVASAGTAIPAAAAAATANVTSAEVLLRMAVVPC